MSPTNNFFFLITLGLFIISGGAEARLYKCVDATGRVEYTQFPCPSTAIVTPMEVVTPSGGIDFYHGTQAPGDYISAPKQRRRAAPKKSRSSNCYKVKTKHGTRCLTASERRKRARALRWEMEGLKTKAFRHQQIYGRPGGVYMPEVKTRGKDGRTLRQLRAERDALLKGIHQEREAGYEE